MVELTAEVSMNKHPRTNPLATRPTSQTSGRGFVWPVGSCACDLIDMEDT